MESVRSVGRAVDILMLLTRERRALGIGDLQSALKLSRPTLYRLLETLIARSLVRVDGEPQRYSLDVAVLQMADAWIAQADVIQTSERVLADVWKRTDETVALALPQGADHWVLAKELRSRQPLAYGRGIGHAHPLTVGASGRVILAYMSSESIEKVLLAEADASRRENIRLSLDQIRQNGFEVAIGELILGALAIAVPVFDRTDAAIASLCLYGPEIRLREPTRSRFVALLIDAAARLSKILGYQGRAFQHLSVSPAS